MDETLPKVLHRRCGVGFLRFLALPVRQQRYGHCDEYIDLLGPLLDDRRPFQTNQISILILRGCFDLYRLHINNGHELVMDVSIGFRTRHRKHMLDVYLGNSHSSFVGKFGPLVESAEQEGHIPRIEIDRHEKKLYLFCDFPLHFDMCNNHAIWYELWPKRHLVPTKRCSNWELVGYSQL